MGNSEPSSVEVEIERLRRALEAEARRSVEIQRNLDGANAEFEEFVSIAAHNLLESLREVASYSQLMAEASDGAAGEYLEHIQEATGQAQTLLGDIVDYWGAMGERPSTPVEMETVLCQALLLADKPIAERGAVVTHDPLPAVIGDFDVLTKVLRHLLANALEYCDAPSPRVHISAVREDSECMFSVRDNGPGIDPEFHGRLFSPFKRLHGQEYPGHGLGLAFCKRAIEWQGGRIWLESPPGAGATFHFALPAAD